jgi:hypothetical protein
LPREAIPFGGQPFLLQFKFRSNQESMLNTLRRGVQVRKLHLLLNALLEFGIVWLQEGNRFHWVLLPHGADEPMTTAYCQEMYAFPPGLNAGPIADEFRGDSFAPIDGLDPLESVDPQAYYSRQPAISTLDRKLEVPSNLETLLDRFFSSSADDRDRFLRACFWLYHAQTVLQDSSSAGLTAFLRAVESLMPDPKSTGTCPCCKRSLGRGARERLREFLDEFAQGSRHSSATLYHELRNKLTHGGSLTFSDLNPTVIGLTQRANEERRLREEVGPIVRVVLINWLQKRPSADA